MDAVLVVLSCSVMPVNIPELLNSYLESPCLAQKLDSIVVSILPAVSIQNLMFAHMFVAVKMVSVFALSLTYTH